MPKGAPDNAATEALAANRSANRKQKYAAPYQKYGNTRYRSTVKRGAGMSIVSQEPNTHQTWTSAAARTVAAATNCASSASMPTDRSSANAAAPVAKANGVRQCSCRIERMPHVIHNTQRMMNWSA